MNIVSESQSNNESFQSENYHSDNQSYDNNENDEEENAIEIIREYGTNRRMDRIHKVYVEQLENIKTRLKGIIIEKDNEIKYLTNERENQGIQLYNLQQQLARSQLALENAHVEYNNLLDMRVKEEELLKEISLSNNEKQLLLTEYNKQYEKYNKELTNINETIRQINKYNDELKNEIELNRRITYKTEQTIQELEKEKDKQDLLTNNLNNEIKLIQEQIDRYTDQYNNQINDTTEIQGVINETSKELELIKNEINQLMVQWKASLVSLSKRDEALEKATMKLAAAEIAVHDYDVEIDGVKRDIQKEQSQHETLMNLRDRLENDLAWVNESIIKMNNERDVLQQRYNLLKKSIQQVDIDIKKNDNLIKQYESENELLLQNISNVTKERQVVENDIEILISSRINVNKANENLLKDQVKLVKSIHEKEIEANEIDNEIARIKVDTLNATAINDQLLEQYNLINKELTDKENLIAKYSLEIRQRNDEIEKKMYRVDRLNKKYEKMVESAGGEENLGPLENTIRNLKKEYDLIDNECKELEREWLKKQTELVSIMYDNNVTSTSNNEISSRITVCTQQQLRLNNNLTLLKANLKSSQNINNNLQKDIQKLNVFINENHTKEEYLQHQNFILEKECIDELKELENETNQIVLNINDVKNEKEKLMNDIIDMERQASLWEKKIQLDKETKEALDPTIGQQETKNMEKEIRRMTLRYEALKKEQDRLINEMEKAIIKRSTISDRFINSAVSNSSTMDVSKSITSPELTQAGIKKRIGLIKRDIRLLNEEIIAKDNLINAKNIAISDISNEIDNLSSTYANAEIATNNLQLNINNLLYNKQFNQEKIIYKQKYLKKLREVTNNNENAIDLNQSLYIERKLLTSIQSLDNVKDIINDIKELYPHLNDVLDRVYAMADIDIQISTD